MRLDKKLLERLRAVARKEHRSVTNLTEIILEKELLRQETPKEESDVLG